MADAVTSQAYDGARNYTIKITDVSDGTGLTNSKIVDVTTMHPNPGPHLKLRRARFSIEGMSLRLMWEATANTDLLLLSTGEDFLDFSKVYAGGYTTAGISGATGNVLLTTIGAAANSNFTLELEFIKGVPLN